MNAGRVLKSLVSASVLFGFLFIALPYLNEVKQSAGNTYQALPYMAALLFIYALFGGLIGIFEHTICEITKPGRWRLNIEKLIFLGIPSAFFACFNLLYSQQFKLPAFIAPIMGEIAVLGRGLSDIAAVLLGYLLVSSVYKTENTRGSLRFSK